MSKERILDQVETTRRRFLKRVIGGGAVLLAIPASTIVSAAPLDGQGKGKGEGKGDEPQPGDGKGKGKGKAKGKGKGKGKAKGKGDN